MKSALKLFCRDDSGAVTVDWVVLTAAIIGLGMIVLIPIAFGTTSLSQGVGNAIGALQPGYGNN